MKFKNVFIYPSWRGRPLLNSFYVKSQFCISNRTNDCFTMEEQYFIFTWKFMIIWVQPFLRIALNSYPSEQKNFQSQQQKIAATVSVSSEHFLASLWQSLVLVKLQVFLINSAYSTCATLLQGSEESFYMKLFKNQHTYLSNFKDGWRIMLDTSKWFAVKLHESKQRRNSKKSLASVVGHEEEHIVSSPLSIYSTWAGACF